jgi:hypothetical protein
VLLPELGPASKAPATAVAKAGSGDHIVVPASEDALEVLSPAKAATPAAAEAASPRPSAAPPPAPIGLSIGFGAAGPESGIKP